MKTAHYSQESDVRLVLLVTYRCNLKCKYCFVPKNDKYMPLEYLMRSVDFLLTSEKKGTLQFHFFGAEPLMMPFGLYEKLVAYAEKRMEETGKKIKFILTTNGVLLDDRKMDFFRKHDFTIELSLDGNPLSQNLNRPQDTCCVMAAHSPKTIPHAGTKAGTKAGADSYGIIVKNLPRIFKSGVANRVSMVISPRTSGYLSENFSHLIRIGFRNLFMMTACGMEWPAQALSNLRQELKKIEPMCLHLIRNKKITFHNIEDWFAPFRMNTELSVDLDGHIYSACHCYLIHDTNIRKKYALGHLDKLDETIDVMSMRRFTNEQAIHILYDVEDILKSVKSNRKAGNIMAAFVERLAAKLGMKTSRVTQSAER